MYSSAGSAGRRDLSLAGYPERKTVLPGVIDAHCHLTGLGMAMISIDCKAPGMQSIEALQKAVYERSTLTPHHLSHRPCGFRRQREMLHGIVPPDTDDEMTAIGRQLLKLQGDV
ncbi:MAG: hypothetical protein ACREOH_03620 [Candidatus Entotheonellia bacterium]